MAFFDDQCEFFQNLYKFSNNKGNIFVTFIQITCLTAMKREIPLRNLRVL